MWSSDTFSIVSWSIIMPSSNSWIHNLGGILAFILLPVLPANMTSCRSDQEPKLGAIVVMLSHKRLCLI